MTDEINEIIKKNLPEQVGAALREELQELKIARDQIKNLTRSMEHRGDQIRHLEESLQDANCRAETGIALSQRTAAIDERERELIIAEALIELREKHAAERIIELRGVVGQVFSNNQFKYSRSFPVHTPVTGNPGDKDGYGATTGFVDKDTGFETVEGEH